MLPFPAVSGKVNGTRHFRGAQLLLHLLNTRINRTDPGARAQLWGETMARPHLLALAGAAFLFAAPADAAGITVGMQLEPPHLDPTAGAAAAIREVTYANLFEGLTRFSQDGTVHPLLAESW
jgi:hypothetical protein